MGCRFHLPRERKMEVSKDKRSSRILAKSFPWDILGGWLHRPALAELQIRLLSLDQHCRRNFLLPCPTGEVRYYNDRGLDNLRMDFEQGFVAEREGDRESAASAYRRCYLVILDSRTEVLWNSNTFWDAVWLLVWAAIGYLPWWQLVKKEYEECQTILISLIDLLPRAGQLTLRLRAMLALLLFDLGYANSSSEEIEKSLDMLPCTMALKTILDLQSPQVTFCQWLRHQHDIMGNYGKVLFWEEERAKWISQSVTGPDSWPELVFSASWAPRLLTFMQTKTLDELLELDVALDCGEADEVSVLATIMSSPDPRVGVDVENTWVQMRLPESYVPEDLADWADMLNDANNVPGVGWFQLEESFTVERSMDPVTRDLANLPFLKAVPRCFHRIAIDILWEGHANRLQDKLLTALRHWTGHAQHLLTTREAGYHRGYFLLCEVILDLKRLRTAPSSQAHSPTIEKLQTAISSFTEYLGVLRTEGDIFHSSFRLASHWLSECYWFRSELSADPFPEEFQRWADGMRCFIRWRNVALDYVVDLPRAADIHLDHFFLGIAHGVLALRTYKSRHSDEVMTLHWKDGTLEGRYPPLSSEEEEDLRKAMHHLGISSMIHSFILSESRGFGEGWLRECRQSTLINHSIQEVHVFQRLIACTQGTTDTTSLVLSERSRARSLVLRLEELLPELPRCLCPENITTADHQHLGFYTSQECAMNCIAKTRMACGPNTVFLEYSYSHLKHDTVLSTYIAQVPLLVIHVFYEGGSLSKIVEGSCLGGKEAMDLEQFHRILIDPVAEVLNRMAVTDKLVISPCHVLNTVPFALLRRSGDGKRLFERHTICVTPSFQALGLSIQVQSQKQNLEHAVAGGVIANPWYFLARERLPQSVKEMEMIRDAFQMNGQEVICLHDRDASPENLLSLVRRCKGFVHVAAHAEAESVNDDGVKGRSRGALRLAEGDDQSRFAGGKLRSEDIMLNVDSASPVPGPDETNSAIWLPQLVVLSACDSGNGQPHSDGSLNLPRAIMGAGVPSVVASLWPVEDSACVEVMTLFYGELRKGDDVSTALRSTMMLMKEDPRLDRWGAFQAWGVPTTCLPEEMLQRGGGAGAAADVC